MKLKRNKWCCMQSDENCVRDSAVSCTRLFSVSDCRV